jgi:hypothetical protein
MGAALASVFCTLILLLAWSVDAPAEAQTAGIEVCYTVSDSTAEAKDGDAEDVLHRVVRADADPATNEMDIGSGTGTFFIEAIAFQPGTEVLFATDAGMLGTLDLVTGRFNPVGSGVGRGSGAHGSVELDDIDGLTFDPTNGDLYGSHRSSRDRDLLLRIDPATGAFVPGAFGGDDYVVVEGLGGLEDIDDLAIDPTDGQMYAIANNDGRGDHLVKLDKATGATTDVGPLGEGDMEGLSFAPDGQLIGTTGKVSGNEAIWDLDKATGSAGNRRPLDNAEDYEGLSCLVSPLPAPPAPAPDTARLIVSKDTRPDSSQEFSFTTTGGPLPGSFTLADGRTVTYSGLPAGTYTVVETPIADWPLEELSCTDPSGGTTTDLTAATASVSLAPGDEVRCLFVNVQAPRAAAASPAPPPAVAAAPAPAPPVVRGETALPRTGRPGRLWSALAGTLLFGGGFSVIVGARPAPRKTRR